VAKPQPHFFKIFGAVCMPIVGFFGKMTFFLQKKSPLYEKTLIGKKVQKCLVKMLRDFV
jgi:hypothetical protein